VELCILQVYTYHSWSHDLAKCIPMCTDYVAMCVGHVTIHAGHVTRVKSIKQKVDPKSPTTNVVHAEVS